MLTSLPPSPPTSPSPSPSPQVSKITQIKSKRSSLNLILVEGYLKNNQRQYNLINLLQDVLVYLITIYIEFEAFHYYTPSIIGTSSYTNRAVERTYCDEQVDEHHIFGDYLINIPNLVNNNIAMLKWTLRFNTNNHYYDDSQNRSLAECISVGITANEEMNIGHYYGISFSYKDNYDDLKMQTNDDRVSFHRNHQVEPAVESKIDTFITMTLYIFKGQLEFMVTMKGCQLSEEASLHGIQLLSKEQYRLYVHLGKVGDIVDIIKFEAKFGQKKSTVIINIFTFNDNEVPSLTLKVCLNMSWKKLFTMYVKEKNIKLENVAFYYKKFKINVNEQMIWKTVGLAGKTLLE